MIYPTPQPIISRHAWVCVTMCTHVYAPPAGQNLSDGIPSVGRQKATANVALATANAGFPTPNVAVATRNVASATRNVALCD